MRNEVKHDEIADCAVRRARARLPRCARNQVQISRLDFLFFTRCNCCMFFPLFEIEANGLEEQLLLFVAAAAASTEWLFMPRLHDGQNDLFNQVFLPCFRSLPLKTIFLLKISLSCIRYLPTTILDKCSCDKTYLS